MKLLLSILALLSITLPAKAHLEKAFVCSYKNEVRVTAYVNKEETQANLELEANNYASKPYQTFSSEQVRVVRLHDICGTRFYFQEPTQSNGRRIQYVLTYFCKDNYADLSYQEVLANGQVARHVSVPLDDCE